MGQANPKLWPPIVDGLDSVNPRIREAAFFATRETYDPALVKALADFLKIPTIPVEPRTDVLKMLAGIYLKAPPWNGDWWNTMPVNGSPPPRTLSWEGTPIIAAAMHDAILDSSKAMRQIAFDWVRSTHDTNQAGLLRAMYDHETDVTMRAGILRALPAVNDTNSRALIAPILDNPQSPAPLLEAAIEMAQKIGGADMNEVLLRLAQNGANSQIVKELYQGFGQYKVKAAAPLLGRNIVNTNYALRLAAVAALTQIGGDTAIAQFLPGLDSPSNEICTQSITALGALRAKQAVPRLLQLSTNKLYSTSAIEALAGIRDLSALDAYLDGLASKNAGLRIQCKAAITSLGDPALTRINAKLTPTNLLSDETIGGLREVYISNAAAKKGPLFKIKIKQTPLSEFQSFAMANDGDVQLGKKIFTDVNGVNCIRCHRLNNQGALVGPELTGIGFRQSRAQIIESVLYPSKLILDGYQQVFFTMKNDDDYAGIVRSEMPDTVTIIDNQGKTNVLQKSQIVKRTISKLSLMPDGLQAGLSLLEFSDLIAYVEQRIGPPPVTRPANVAKTAPPQRTTRPSQKPTQEAANVLEWPASPLELPDSFDPPAPLAPSESPTPPPNDAQAAKPNPAAPPKIPPRKNPPPDKDQGPPPLPPMPPGVQGWPQPPH